MKEESNILNLKEFIKENQFSLVYVSSEKCSVCKVLLPKILEITNKYPNIKTRFVDLENMPEIASTFNIFTAPLILFFIDGKEYLRESAYVQISEFDEKINRLYTIYQ
ncbi:MAG: thioredoxin family protein [Clostridiaceae bacterium]